MECVKLTLSSKTDDRNDGMAKIIKDPLNEHAKENIFLHFFADQEKMTLKIFDSLMKTCRRGLCIFHWQIILSGLYACVCVCVCVCVCICVCVCVYVCVLT